VTASYIIALWECRVVVETSIAIKFSTAIRIRSATIRCRAGGTGTNWMSWGLIRGRITREILAVRKRETTICDAAL